jgi:FkbM family methyltransferase
MLKDIARSIAQKVLGFKNYLVVFSIFTINKIRLGKSDKEFLHFVSLIPDKGVILDIGANIGIMTVLMAREKRNAIVYAFEPVPENITALKAVIQFYRLPNVKIFPIAVGENNGSLQMILPEQAGAKMQGLSHVVNESNEKGKLFSVPVQKLDDVDQLIAISKVAAIKIDVENFEYYVLKGGVALLKKHRPIIYCELWDNDFRRACMELIISLDYEVRVFENGKLCAFSGQVINNFFFLPI